MKKRAQVFLLCVFGLGLGGCGPNIRNVVDYPLAEGITFSGELQNKLPNGQGVIQYSNGDELLAIFSGGHTVGEVTFNRAIDGAVFSGTGEFSNAYAFQLNDGKLTFQNGQFYEGKFVNNVYEDSEGLFSFHTISMGVTTYDWQYEGGFHEGSASGQHGSVRFPAYFTGAQGLWFLDNVQMAQDHVIADNQQAQGKVRYESAYYEGNGFYSSETFIPGGEGKTVFDNDCHYVGEYKNGVYDGHGVFSWANGTRYEGNFAHGSPDGCLGTIYYPVAKYQAEGLWYFTGRMQGFVKPQKGVGKGFIKFGDKSTYEGDVYFDGNQGWFRKGEGVQDFSACGFSGEVAGGPAGSKLYKYVGSFDYRVSAWIFGDGVFYFTDQQNRPIGWTKGFYSALVRVNEYLKAPSEITLLPGFTPEMEVPYTPEVTKVTNYQNKYKDRSNVQVLFGGDSYMEMWYSSFGIANYDSDMADFDTMNVGIGGTVFQQWYGWKDALVGPFAPQRIVLHLGFNDLHLGLTVDDVFTNMTQLVAALKTILPATSIYLLTVEPSPTFASYRVKEAEYNQRLKEYATTSSLITVIDTAGLFLEQDGMPITNLAAYFISDGVHLNAAGYSRWVEMIKSRLA